MPQAAFIIIYYVNCYFKVVAYIILVQSAALAKGITMKS